ncbi:MAG TPA: sensor histidine kinase, partial [Longimicrobium sp.]|nr:sensor histidine kinase [Longimicrobium sp.]
RVATAVSEVARNAFGYAGGGTVELSLAGDGHERALVVRVADPGLGIAELSAVLAGANPPEGQEGGIAAVRRLVDELRVDSSPGSGKVVTLLKRLPAAAPPVTPALVERIADALAGLAPDESGAEIRRQNGELLRALAALEQRGQEMDRLNAELAETNRGVLALHAELRERAEREQAAREAAEAATRARDAALAIVSHDLRNPVGAVLTGTAFLLDTLPPDAEGTGVARQISVIHRAAGRASRMLDDLMDVTRIEAGQLAVYPERVEVGSLLAEALEMVRVPAAEAGLELRVEDPGKLPPVMADRDRILQLFSNLAGNAVKFTPRGGRVTLGAAAAGSCVSFSVADSGVGMTGEQVEHAFDRFWQAGQGDRRGVGLGLSIARGIVAAHAGTLTVESSPGAGSVFRFTLAEAAE